MRKRCVRTWANATDTLFGLVEGHAIDLPSGDDQQLELAEDPLSFRRRELKEEILWTWLKKCLFAFPHRRLRVCYYWRLFIFRSRRVSFCGRSWLARVGHFWVARSQSCFLNLMCVVTEHESHDDCQPFQSCVLNK